MVKTVFLIYWLLRWQLDQIDTRNEISMHFYLRNKSSDIIIIILSPFEKLTSSILLASISWCESQKYRSGNLEGREARPQKNHKKRVTRAYGENIPLARCLYAILVCSWHGCGCGFVGFWRPSASKCRSRRNWVRDEAVERIFPNEAMVWGGWWKIMSWAIMSRTPPPFGLGCISMYQSEHMMCGTPSIVSSFAIMPFLLTHELCPQSVSAYYKLILTPWLQRLWSHLN